MKSIYFCLLALSFSTSLWAQEVVKTKLEFENADSGKKINVMVGDQITIRFKKPEIEMESEILSLTDSTLIISTRKAPFTQTVFLTNIQSIVMRKRGNLSLLSEVEFNQDSTVYRIETSSGNEFVGRIVSQNQEKMTIKTEQFGEITIQKKAITDIEIVSEQEVKGGVLWSDNPQASRHFWSPNGYGIKKGEGYYQNVWILINQWTYAPTDRFSVGAGIIPLFLFGGASTPVWMTAKFSIPLRPDKINMGVGVLSGTVLGESGSGFGIPFGMVTFGSRDNNATLGMGYGYAGGGWAKRPLITFSGLFRTGPRSYFVTENYYVGTVEDQLLMLSFGGRRIVKKVGIDYGLFVPFTTGQESFVAIPWLGLTVPFGKRR